MKKFSLICIAALLLITLPGCGSNTAPSGSQDGDKATAAQGVEIVVVSPFDESDGNRENFVNAYTAFEEQTGNNVVDLASASNEEWKSRVLTDFESGNEPDVLFFFVGADADKLVNGEKVVSISDIRKEYPDFASNMKESLMPVSTANGRQYAVPLNGYWEGLFVNKKVLSDCGVDVPGADYEWDQFLADCEIIKEKGYVPVACSLFEVPHYWFEYCTFNHGNVSNHSARPESSNDAVGKRWVAGLSDIQDLYERGFLPEDTNTATDSETNQLMTDNKAAFMIDGSWKVGWFRDNAKNIDDFSVKYVPAMGERKTTDIIGGLSMGYYITKKAWNDPAKREACVLFVQAMTTDDVVSSFAALSITALKNGTTPPENADSIALSALEMTRNCTGIAAAAQDLLSPDARKNLFDDVSRIAVGAMTPQEAIDSSLALM